MDHMTSHQKLSYKGSIVYYIKNQLIIVGIDNQYFIYLFGVIYINKKINQIML